jgi:hypothetical protein
LTLLYTVECLLLNLTNPNLILQRLVAVSALRLTNMQHLP